MTIQIHPGDRVLAYQYSDTRLTLSDRAALRAAAANPWQLPPQGDEQHWRKLPLWCGCNGYQWEIVVLKVNCASGVATVTSPNFPLPLCADGVQIPLSHIEIIESGVYDQSQLDRICRGLPPIADADTDAPTKLIHPSPQVDRASKRRQSSASRTVRGGDRASTNDQAQTAQQSIF